MVTQDFPDPLDNGSPGRPTLIEVRKYRCVPSTPDTHRLTSSGRYGGDTSPCSKDEGTPRPSPPQRCGPVSRRGLSSLVTSPFVLRRTSHPSIRSLIPVSTVNTYTGLCLSCKSRGIVLRSLVGVPTTSDRPP